LGGSCRLFYDGSVADLGEAGLTATKMEADAKVTLEQIGGGFAITAIRLTLKAGIPGADDKKFQELAVIAKANCPVSNVLDAEISLNAYLTS
jgi:osmotically inducible protein OsmC